jgi:hypothetical protein
MIETDVPVVFFELWFIRRTLSHTDRMVNFVKGVMR